MLETFMVAQLWLRPWLPSRHRRLVRKQLSGFLVEHQSLTPRMRQETRRPPWGIARP